MAYVWNYFSGKKATVERFRHAGLQLLPQESVVIIKRDRGDNKLGEGSYTKVFVGKYMGKDRTVKVFTFLKEDVFSSDKVKEEFERLNSFKHPNIVRVYGMWEDPHKGRNSLAIVMELCDGSLYQFTEQCTYKGISSEQKLKILHDITCAMVYLHSQSVVHGDLKTPNVLVNKTKTVVTAKLTDFGMAHVLNDSKAHFTASPIDDEELQLMVEGFQKKCDKRPDKKMLEEKQREIEYLRSAMEADQVTLSYEPPTPSPVPMPPALPPHYGVQTPAISGPAPHGSREEFWMEQDENVRQEDSALNAWLKQYEKVIQEQGSVSVQITRCVLIGPARVGKSCLKQLLVHNEPRPVHKSTDMMEAPVVLTSMYHSEKSREIEYLISAMEADQVALNYEGANQAKLKLENDKELWKAEVQSKEKECSLLRSDETRLKLDHESLRQKLKTTESEVSQLRTEQSRTSSDMKGKDAKLGEQQDLIRHLRCDLKEVRHSLDVDIKKLKAEVKAHKEEIQFSERQRRQEKITSTKLQEIVQQLKDQKEKLEEEITTLKETLSKDGQSRMLAEVHKFVKSELPEQMSAFGKDSAKLQAAQRSQLKDMDELIANLEKTDTEGKGTYAKQLSDLYKITMTMATKEDIEASIRKLWKEGRAQEEIKVEKLSLQVEYLQCQLTEKQTHLDSVEDQLSSLSLEKKNLEAELARQKTIQAGLKEVIQNHGFKQKQSADQIRKLDVMLEKLSERNQEKEQELQGQVAKLTKLNQRLSIRNTVLLGLKDKSNVNALETISLGSKAPERDLMQHCWLPFGLQTMVVEAEGAPVYLHPPPPAHVTHSEAVLLPPVSLEAPLGCINTEVCSKLYLRYGIVVWGPNSLPEGLQLASVGVYIYFDSAHCVNPPILRIPHWSGSEGQGKLKSVVASLLLEGGGEGKGERYKFEEFGSEGLTVSGAAGSMLLPLPGSGIYCLVQKEGAPSRYIASSFETNGTGGSNLDVRFTYHSSVWMQILDKYFPKPSTSVRFQFKEDRLQGQMERTSGGGWRACMVGTGVTEQEQCESGFAGLKNGRELLSAVQRGVYPPVISCRTEYSSQLRETGARTSAVMVVSGVKGAPLTFGVTTYEYITERKSPLGTESDSTPTALTSPTTAVAVLHPSSVATSPVRVTSSVQATPPVRVTSSVQATPPVRVTSSVQATPPVRVTSSVQATPPVRVTSSVQATPPVRVTSFVQATPPVRVTSSVQATPPVRVMSSVQATCPPVQATLPSTTAENVRQRPSSLAASLVAMIDLDSNEDASSSQNAKRFCLRYLMPFVAPLSQDFEALAHHMHIAGELKERVVVEADGNRYSQLQKLFTAWLSEGDSEEAPHNWEFFISVVRRIGKPGLAEEIAKQVYV